MDIGPRRASRARRHHPHVRSHRRPQRGIGRTENRHGRAPDDRGQVVGPESLPTVARTSDRRAASSARDQSRATASSATAPAARSASTARPSAGPASATTGSPASLSRRPRSAKPGHALAELPAPGWRTTASATPSPRAASHALAAVRAVSATPSRTKGIVSGTRSERRQGLDEVTAHVAADGRRRGGSRHHHRTAQRGEAGAKRRIPRPEPRHDGVVPGKGPQRTGTRRLLEEAVEGEAFEVHGGVHETRALEERARVGRWWPGSFDSPASAGAPARARPEARRRAPPGGRPDRSGSHGRRTPRRPSRCARAPSGRKVARHEVHPELASPPAEERAAEDIRQEMRIEDDPRDPDARRRGDEPTSGGERAPIRRGRRRPRTPWPRGPTGNRDNRAPRSTASERTRAGRASRTASRSRRPSPRRAWVARDRRCASPLASKVPRGERRRHRRPPPSTSGRQPRGARRPPDRGGRRSPPRSCPGA